MINVMFRVVVIFEYDLSMFLELDMASDPSLSNYLEYSTVRGMENLCCTVTHLSGDVLSAWSTSNDKCSLSFPYKLVRAPVPCRPNVWLFQLPSSAPSRV
jgi:hypothetical protein